MCNRCRIRRRVHSANRRGRRVDRSQLMDELRLVPLSCTPPLDYHYCNTLVLSADERVHGYGGSVGIAMIQLSY